MEYVYKNKVLMPLKHSAKCRHSGEFLERKETSVVTVIQSRVEERKARVMKLSSIPLWIHRAKDVEG